MCDFTDDEIRCLKKVIYREREEEILELYKKEFRAYQEKTKLERQYEEKAKEEAKPQKKSFLDNVKEFFNGMGTAI